MPSNNRFYPQLDTLRQEIVGRNDNIMLEYYDDVVVTFKNFYGYDENPELTSEFNSAMVRFIGYMLHLNNDSCRLSSAEVMILYKVFIKFNPFVYKHNRFRFASISKAHDMLNDNRASEDCKHLLRLYISIHEPDDMDIT